MKPTRGSSRRQPKVGRGKSLSTLTPRASEDRTRRRPALALRVSLLNRQQIVSINRTQFKAAILDVLQAEDVRQAQIEIALVDDSAIREVHRRFLNLDTPTDVLTFPLHDPGEPLFSQIVISTETAAREAPYHGLQPEEEVLLYAIHGILHLCGYNDHSTRDARRMQRRQESLLRRLVPQA